MSARSGAHPTAAGALDASPASHASHAADASHSTAVAPAVWTRLVVAGTLACAATAAAAQADELPQATPYRPGVGSPAVLSATGYFELEAGYDNLRVTPVRSDSLSLLLKYGLSDRLGLLVGLNPTVRLSGPDGAQSGVSDTAVGLKFVQRGGPQFAWGAQLVSTLPTGSRLLRSDTPVPTLTALAGFDWAQWHSDLNLGVTRLGDNPGSGISRQRYGWSASLSRPVVGPWSGAVELSGARQVGLGNSAQVLGSLSYSVSRRLVLDAYVARGRSNGNGIELYNTGFGTGLTYLFAQ